MDWTTTLLPYATAFGLALLHSLWIGIFLYTTVKALWPLLPGPTARHHLAYGALLLMGVAFGLTLYLNYDPTPVCENLAAGVPITNLPISGAAAAELTWMEWFQERLPDFAPWLSLAYLIGLLPAAFGLIKDQERVWEMRRNGLLELPTHWSNLLTEELNRHSTTRRVKCYLSEKAGEVMTLGFWSPVIVFPVALVNELSPEMARTILLHELAHLRHYDHWLNYPQQFLKIFFFYHPAAHALCQLIDQEREHRCDDWVAGHCADRRTYASALVTVARTSHIPPNKLVMSATKTHFTTRIQRLFLGEQRHKDQHFTFSILLFVLLGGGHLGFAYLGEDAGAVDCLGEQKAILTSIPYLSDTPLNLVSGQSKQCNEPTYLISTWDYDAPQPPAANDSRSWDRYERAVEKYEEKRFAAAAPRQIMVLAKDPDAPVSLSSPRGDAQSIFIPSEKVKALPLPASLNLSTSLPSLPTIKRPCPLVDTVPPSGKTELTFETEKEGTKIIIRTDQGDDNKKPAIFLNGKLQKGDIMNKIDPATIESVQVYKKEEDLLRMGVAGYQGAVRITTKGHKPSKAEKELFPEVKHIDTEDKGKLQLKLPEDMKAAYFLDDERSDAATIEALSNEQIDRVEVIKRESAVKAMELEGFDAVVMVYTKK